MRPENTDAFLYSQAGVNENLTAIARQELKDRGVVYKEVDLSGQQLDKEWPVLPVISSRLGTIGGFKNKESVEAVVSLVAKPEVKKS